MSATKALTMSDFEEAFLEDARTLYGMKPESFINNRSKRYTVTQCLMSNPNSKYRAMCLAMMTNPEESVDQ